MNMLLPLSKRAPPKIFISILLGAISGIAYSLLIPLITSALATNNKTLSTSLNTSLTIFDIEIATVPLAPIFTAACLLILICRTLSQIILAKVALQVASDLRISIYHRIAGAPLAILERLGSPRISATMSTDVPKIIIGAQMLPELLVSSITLIGMLSYLLYLSSDIFWFVLLCIFFGAFTYQIPLMLGKRQFVRAGESTDSLHKSIHGLIYGIKELKLNEKKREAYFATDLVHNEYAVLRAQSSGNTIMSIAGNYGDMLSFFVLGAIIFFFAEYASINSHELVGVIMALLYITAPVATILGIIPQISMAQVSLERVNLLLSELSSERSAPAKVAAAWESLRLENVVYEHGSLGDTAGFRAGPFNIQFKRGEITFIVGGNGSGKSTLCKLLTLHYTASSGRIFFGETMIKNDTVNTYRQNIAAIYSDYYLFNKIFGKNVEAHHVDYYLKLLKLDTKVKYRNGEFSTISLSDGQRRRLALLTTFIEDKELYLFDEWAADQDPTFKEVFYYEILPSLKAKGKTVIAITHDDRYFHVADKVIIMADGKVVST